MYYFENPNNPNPKMNRYELSSLENHIMNYTSDELYYAASQMLHSGEFDKHFTGKYAHDCNALQSLANAKLGRESEAY